MKRVSASLLVLSLTLISLACGGLLSAPFTPPEAGGAPWVELTSPGFRLQSDLEPVDAWAAVGVLERMRAMLGDLGFTSSVKPLERTRVVLFRRPAEYRDVAPLGSAGVFSSRVWLGGDGPELRAPVSQPAR